MAQDLGLQVEEVQVDRSQSLAGVWQHASIFGSDSGVSTMSIDVSCTSDRNCPNGQVGPMRGPSQPHSTTPSYLAGGHLACYSRHKTGQGASSF
mmetsp:Transcript_79404/g.140120  ORF Transcript_79404/g.140120 Transcript_79404/m.140120 type:complete len:94 (-) Transcript_79404:531-812(-)